MTVVGIVLQETTEKNRASITCARPRSAQNKYNHVPADRMLLVFICKPLNCRIHIETLISQILVLQPAAILWYIK